jgi:hypothetical protein
MLDRVTNEIQNFTVCSRLCLIRVKVKFGRLSAAAANAAAPSNPMSLGSKLRVVSVCGRCGASAAAPLASMRQLNKRSVESRLWMSPVLFYCAHKRVSHTLPVRYGERAVLTPNQLDSLSFMLGHWRTSRCLTEGRCSTPRVSTSSNLMAHNCSTLLTSSPLGNALLTKIARTSGSGTLALVDPSASVHGRRWPSFTSRSFTLTLATSPKVAPRASPRGQSQAQLPKSAKLG